ncbi:MAG: hypothetical protein M1840_002559 [Geoglossum simile]|nr:MAG: hypothetical protein M1840_002559 [Geoglossum simile]
MLEQECFDHHEIQTYVSQMREKASKKQKCIPGSHEQTVSKAQKALEALKYPRTAQYKAKQSQ